MVPKHVVIEWSAALPIALNGPPVALIGQLRRFLAALRELLASGGLRGLPLLL